MLKLSFLNLFRRKTRTFLALLGIAIGTAAIISLVSAVDGSMQSFNEAISQFQGISVLSKDSQDQTLSKIKTSYIKKLEKIKGVRTVIPEIWFIPSKIDNKTGGLNSEFGFQTSIYGVDIEKYNKQRGTGMLGDIKQGSFLKKEDKEKVVLGSKIADDLDKFVGSTIKVNNKKFRVKGILSTENELWGSIIVMSLKDAREIASFPEDTISSITLELENPEQDKKIAKQINFLFKPELEAFTVSDFSEQLSSIIGGFRMAVLFVAAISAVVAGIGIINTILMSVLDRKKEIGALKATGWTKSEIIKMILIESGLLGLIGATTGILLGLTISSILNSYGITTLVSNELLIQSFLFGVITGTIAGLYPAWLAANMNPVEAMSYG